MKETNSEPLWGERPEPFTLLQDLVMNWWVILLAGLAGLMLATVAAQQGVRAHLQQFGHTGHLTRAGGPLPLFPLGHHLLRHPQVPRQLPLGQALCLAQAAQNFREHTVSPFSMDAVRRRQTNRTGFFPRVLRALPRARGSGSIAAAACEVAPAPAA